MNQFDSSVVDTTEKTFGPSKYITYGIQDLKINKMEVKVAGTGSKQIIFSVEGSPVKDATFEGVDGASGPVGRISTMYAKPEGEKDFVMIFGKIADAMGVREKLNACKADSLEAYVALVEKVLTGKFASFVVASEQYWDVKAGKAKNSFRFPKYDFVEKQGTVESRLKFDKANSYHFKAAVVPTDIGTETSATKVEAKEDDLPF